LPFVNLLLLKTESNKQRSGAEVRFVLSDSGLFVQDQLLQGCALNLAALFLLFQFLLFQAMENFRLMFPDLSPKQIEEVLRKNDGDVENSINDLLKLGKFDEQPARRGSSHASCSSSSYAPSYSHKSSFDQPK
jgi:hypothetical protein